MDLTQEGEPTVEGGRRVGSRRRTLSIPRQISPIVSR